jgi:putative oxidoreductase
MTIGTVAIRGVVGPLFIGHGTQKLFGWFGGHGLEGTGGFFESIGMRPGRRHATAAGVAEALGGALITIGALTPLASTMVIGTMATAIRKVHAPNGPWVTDNGYEYTAVVIAAMVALTDLGPGRPSLDARLCPDWKGPTWAVAALGAGVAGSYVIDMLSEPAPPEPTTTASPDGEARFAKDSEATPTTATPEA